MGHPEIDEFDGPRMGDHDVRGFDVPVYDAVLIHHFQRLADRDQDRQPLLKAEFAVPGDHILEGDAIDKLHGIVENIAAATDIVYLRDVRMIEFGDDPRFLDEQFAELLFGRQFKRYDLKRHLSFQGHIPSLQDTAHASGADQRDDAVVVQLFSDDAVIESDVIRLFLFGCLLLQLFSADLVGIVFLGVKRNGGFDLGSALNRRGFAGFTGRCGVGRSIAAMRQPIERAPPGVVLFDQDIDVRRFLKIIEDDRVDAPVDHKDPLGLFEADHQRDPLLSEEGGLDRDALVGEASYVARHPEEAVSGDLHADGGDVDRCGCRRFGRGGCADRSRGRGLRLLGRRVLRRRSKRLPDPADQDVRIQRIDEVIDGAEFKQLERPPLSFQWHQEHDGNVFPERILFDEAEKLQTADIVQGLVADDQPDRMGCQDRQGISHGGGRMHGISRGLQQGGDARPEALVLIDEKDIVGGTHEIQPLVALWVSKTPTVPRSERIRPALCFPFWVSGRLVERTTAHRHRK